MASSLENLPINADLNLSELYHKLYENYGPQGWWPLLSYQSLGTNPTKRGLFTGYHLNDYQTPHKEIEKFEIMLGAILTQNTSWINAEKALWALNQRKMLSPKKLGKIAQEELAELIRSSGYYNQKAKKIQNLLNFLQENPISQLESMEIEHLRKILLLVNGIGPETADSMILYALKKPIFVVDAYTKRLLVRLGKISPNPSYEQIQTIFHSEIPKDLNIFNEYHALIVQHCVHTCKKKPDCEKCFLNSQCPKIIPIKEKKKKQKKVKK